ncbi:MAG TPA: hypothetical protein PKC80_11175 [Burkholderiaceae bacterium]|nr:hypothetical protein [Burkholderiaceae bacterium]
MTPKLTLIYQLASWVCTGLAWTNSAVLLWDGSTGHLQMQYQIVTFAVALLFGVLGGIMLGVERSLSRIYLNSVNISMKQPGADSVGAWRLLYVCLITGLLFIIFAMASSLVAISARMQQGMHIFG